MTNLLSVVSLFLMALFPLPAEMRTALQPEPLQESNLAPPAVSIPGLSFVSLDSPRLSPGMVNVVRERGGALGEPYVFVLWNQSPRRIKALTLTFILTGEDGSSRSLYISESALTRPTDIAVAGAGSQLVITAEGFAEAIVPGRGGGSPPVPIPTGRLLEQFRNARRVTLEVDAVVFDDGAVWGPDRSGTLENIKAKRAAIEALVQGARDVLNRGASLGSYLNQFASQADWEPTGGSWQRQLRAVHQAADPAAFWMAESARSALNSSSPIQLINQPLYPVPAFLRQEGER